MIVHVIGIGIMIGTNVEVGLESKLELSKDSSVTGGSGVKIEDPACIYQMKSCMLSHVFLSFFFDFFYKWAFIFFSSFLWRASTSWSHCT